MSTRQPLPDYLNELARRISKIEDILGNQPDRFDYLMKRIDEKNRVIKDLEERLESFRVAYGKRGDQLQQSKENLIAVVEENTKLFKQIADANQNISYLKNEIGTKLMKHGSCCNE